MRSSHLGSRKRARREVSARQGRHMYAHIWVRERVFEGRKKAQVVEHGSTERETERQRQRRSESE